MVITANPPKFDKRQPSKGGYDVIVYIDGSQVVAEDSNGRKICPPGVAGSIVLQSALDYLAAHGGGRISQINGTYIFSEKVTYTGSNLEWIGIGTVINDFSGVTATSGAVNIYGTITGTTTTLSENALEGANSITVTDAASFEAGDYIRLRSEAVWNGGSAKYAEIFQIVSKVDSMLTLDGYTNLNYLTTDTAAIDKLNIVQNITLENLDFLGNRINYWTGLDIECAKDVHIKDVKFDNAYYVAAYFEDVVNLWVSESTFENNDHAGVGYGIDIANACKNVFIEDNVFRNCRHGIACGTGGYGVQINQLYDGNKFEQGTFATKIGFLGPHNSYKYLIAANNQVNGDGLGYFDSMYNDVYGNTVNCKNAIQNGGIYVSSNGHNTTVRGNIVNVNAIKGINVQSARSVRLSENKVNVSGSDHCIYASGNIEDLKMEENTLSNAGTGNGIYISSTGATTTLDSIRAIDNDISTVNKIGIYIRCESAANMTNVDVSNNRIRPGSASGKGIYVSCATGQKVSYFRAISNEIYNGRFGIELKNVEYADIIGNSINVGHTGIYLYSSDLSVTGANIYDNSVYNCAAGAKINNQAGATNVRNNLGHIAPGESRSVSGPLTAGNADAIAFAWHNPNSQDILIKKVTIRIITPGGTAGSLLDVGIADDATGTNLGTEFFNDIDLNTAAIVKSTIATPGTQTVEVLCQDSASATDAYVVGKILVENASSLVGSYYIEYEGA